MIEKIENINSFEELRSFLDLHFCRKYSKNGACFCPLSTNEKCLSNENYNNLYTNYYLNQTYENLQKCLSFIKKRLNIIEKENPYVSTYIR